uniref:guanylate cyclase n=1 Tax=Panagrolaimus davidi TaxID=227884 RepID=A0A914QA24_9BILA
MTYLSCYGVCIGVKQAGSMTGTSVANSFKSSQITQFPYGPIEFDAAGIRLPQYNLSWQNKNGTLMIAYTATFIKSTCVQNRCFEVSITAVNDIAWKNNRNPTLNECVYNGGCVNYVPYIIGGGVAIFLISIMILFFFYRRQRRLDAFRMHWKIVRSAIKVIENKQSSVKGKGGNPDATTLSSKRRVIPAYAILETTKAEFIALKHMSHIRFGKDELNYIMDLKRINHDNLTNFIGICYNDGDKFYILHNLVERASLEDYVFDSDFKLDETFRSAFLRDILKGLSYLHKSPVGYHGLLSLSNCLIDANWVLKLTNFGSY